MKVRDLMSKTVHTCSPGTTLAEVGVTMFQQDCGVVPVVEEHHVIGMVTDRDICIAVATKGRRGDEIRIGEIIQGRQVFSCQADDEVAELIESMRAHRVRRVPVVDEDGVLEGIVSISDLVAGANKTKGRNGSITYSDVVDTLKEICSSPVDDQIKAQAKKKKARKKAASKKATKKKTKSA